MDNKNNIKRILIYWTIFSGILLANVYPLSLMMPLNKKIWSISFVFITCGIAGIALTLLTLAIDVKGKGDDSYSRFVKLISQPFVYLGRNPLAIYVLLMGSQSIIGLIPAGEHNLWDQIYYYGLESWLPAGFASTLYGIIWAVILTLVAWKMYQKNIFIRL